MAKTTYKMAFMPHPFNEDSRRKGMWALCLVKVATPGTGPAVEEAVAVFRLDSEADLLQARVPAEESDGPFVAIDPNVAEWLQVRREAGMA